MTDTRSLTEIMQGVLGILASEGVTQKHVDTVVAHDRFTHDYALTCETAAGQSKAKENLVFLLKSAGTRPLRSTSALLWFLRGFSSGLQTQPTNHQG